MTHRAGWGWRGVDRTLASEDVARWKCIRRPKYSPSDLIFSAPTPSTATVTKPTGKNCRNRKLSIYPIYEKRAARCRPQIHRSNPDSIRFQPFQLRGSRNSAPRRVCRHRRRQSGTPRHHREKAEEIRWLVVFRKTTCAGNKPIEPEPRC